MSKSLFTTLLALLLVTSFSEDTNTNTEVNIPLCPPTANYTFNLLTLWWAPEFCQRQEGQCVSGWQEGWSGTLALIHGYWPSSAESSYLDCFGYDGVKSLPTKQNSFKT